MRRPTDLEPVARTGRSVQETCARLGVSRAFGYTEIARGRLKSSKVGRRRIITAGQEAAYIALIENEADK